MGDVEGHSYSLCYVMLVMRRKFRALWRDFWYPMRELLNHFHVFPQKDLNRCHRE